RKTVEDSDLVKWAPNPETALLFADQFSVINLKREFFVIGGEEIYNVFDKYINVVCLTDVYTGPINGDAKFTKEFKPPEWIFRYEKEFQKSEIDDYAFRISCIVRRKPYHRILAKHNLFRNDIAANEAWERYVALIRQTPADDPLDHSQLDFLERL